MRRHGLAHKRLLERTMMGFVLWLADLRACPKRQAFPVDWVLSDCRGNFMIGYLDKSTPAEGSKELG